MRTILIVEDEPKIQKGIDAYLRKENYQTILAGSGIEALELFQKEKIDLIILDLMLPDLSGEEVCEKVRKVSPVPILMLTAKVEEEDRVKGLNLGADDYLTKPFSLRELVARVQAILRRSTQDLLAQKLSYYQGRLEIDATKQAVFKDRQLIHLTPAEYKILLLLVRYPGRPFQREELIERVYGFDYEGVGRGIDQHIKNLRQKLEDHPKSPNWIVTIHGFGYCFKESR